MKAPKLTVKSVTAIRDRAREEIAAMPEWEDRTDEQRGKAVELGTLLTSAIGWLRFRRNTTCSRAGAPTEADLTRLHAALA